MKWFSMLTLSLLLIPQPSSAALCAQSLAFTNSTERLIAYLNLLLDQRVIDQGDIVRFSQSLQSATLINPISDQDAVISSSKQVHQREIAAQLRNADRLKLLEWSQNLVKDHKRIEGLRADAKGDTRDVFQKIEFHSLPGGTLIKDGKRVVVPPFEMMSTPVTQKQWVEIMGENPSFFVDGNDSIILEINGMKYKMRPDNPIENISWWSAAEFANRLSTRAGLTPFYDFSTKNFASGRPEGGSLKESVRWRSNYKVSDFQKDGYRMPTNEELAYMFVTAETEKRDTFELLDATERERYAWGENAGESTHPVGQLLPLSIDGKPFYDLIDNVSEYTSTAVEGKQFTAFLIRGGNWIMPLSISGPTRAWANDQTIFTGFRLVRTLK